MDEVEVDLEEVKRYLEARKNVKVFFGSSPGKIYTFEFIEKMKEVRRLSCVEFDKCFARVEGDGGFYCYEIKCDSCLELDIISTTKTQFINNLKEERYECKKCVFNKEKKEKRDWHKEKKENTEFYIESYLNPHKDWEEGLSVWEKWNYLTCVDPLDDELISKIIKEMPYSDFLRTPYWIAIAQKKRKQADFKCQLCNSNDTLNVHHRTYENHGDELNHLKDLIVLCKECHEKFHEVE